MRLRQVDLLGYQAGSLAAVELASLRERTLGLGRAIGEPQNPRQPAMRFGLGVATYFTERTGFLLEAGYILPLTGDISGDDSFGLIPITASLFLRLK